MKKSILVLLGGLMTMFTYAQVGVGTTTPDAHAQLDVVSSTKGVFIPRLTASQVSTLAGNLDATDDGLIIYNTTEQCIQAWKWTALPAPASGKFECLAVVTGGALGNAGAVKVNVTGALAARDANNTTHPSFMGWANSGGRLPIGQFQPFGSTLPIPGFTGSRPVSATDLNLSAAPTTNWPENTPVANRNLTQPNSAIYRDQNVFESTPALTADAWLENSILGQVNIWRITVLGNPGNSSGYQMECRLRNPESGFTTGYVQAVPAASGNFAQTFTLTTIADNQSLPSGGGDGYVLEFRVNDGALDIWVESITRISLYNE